MAFPAIPTAAAVKGFVTSKKFLIPAAIFLLFAAIATGVFFYLKKDKADAVETAVSHADAQHTIHTYETVTKVKDATVTIDVKMDRLRDQTIRDYTYVQSRIDNAPQEQRQAQVPPLLIDTINELDRLRSLREVAAANDPPVGP